ncbi:MAG: aldo/keto reductase [Chloroflexota bacterium]
MNALNEYRVLGQSGLRVSPLCLGTMTFGTGDGWTANETTSRAVFEYYIEQGGNFIDTAISYAGGASETLLGKFIAGRRERLVLATKYSVNTRPGDPNAGGNHRKNIVQSIETSLKRLGTDYIDLYFLHMWEGRTPIEEIMRALDDLVHSGKILYLGISDTPAWQVSRANMLAELRGWTSFIALQIEYSLGQRTGERELVPMARDLGIGVLPWSPLGGGIFSGKYSQQELILGNPEPKGTRKAWMQQFGRFTERNMAIAEVVTEIGSELGCSPAQVAIAWTLAQPGVTSTILGARLPEQLKDNLKALTLEFRPDDLQALEQISKIELGFPHDFLAQTRPSAIDGGLVIRTTSVHHSM